MTDVLAARAISQYRTRDIFTYLSLRYFLVSSRVKTDDFISTNVVRVVRGYNAPAYNQTPFFKEKGEDGVIKHRLMHMPGAAEALAEAALLAHCANRGLSPDKDVCFSYWLAEGESKSGYFVPYLVGLRDRQDAIRNALHAKPGAIVRCVDIKNFYPSITEAVAVDAWKSACGQAEISPEFRELGLQLIRKHRLERDRGFLLTGPMFSHFIANLVLSGVDKSSKEMPANVFRYVDDFSIIGSVEDIEITIEHLNVALGGLGLTLHDSNSPKTLNVTDVEWLDSADDFSMGPISAGWLRLVGNVKKVLILQREEPEIFGKCVL